MASPSQDDKHSAFRERVEAGFAGTLNAKYLQRLSAEKLMVNELYLTVLFRPVIGAAPGLLYVASTDQTGRRAI